MRPLSWGLRLTRRVSIPLTRDDCFRTFLSAPGLGDKLRIAFLDLFYFYRTSRPLYRRCHSPLMTSASCALAASCGEAGLRRRPDETLSRAATHSTLSRRSPSPPKCTYAAFSPQSWAGTR